MIANKNKPLGKYIYKNRDMLFSLSILLVMFLIVSNPVYFSNSTVEGIKLFFFNVFPGLFPFMLLTKFLTEIGFVFKVSKRLDRFSKKIFGTPGVSFYAFFMSIISGYPIGAKIISELYQKKLITDQDAHKMTLFCTTSGPIFVIGTVGSFMFLNKTIGVVLYFSHILSAIFMAIIYNLITQKNAKYYQNNVKIVNLQADSDKNIISSCIKQTIDSILIVGAYITIFYLLIEILTSLKIIFAINFIVQQLFKIFGINTNLSLGSVYGLLEITRGCKEISLIKSYQSVALCSALISFSGLSIIFQSMAFLKEAKIKMHNFILVKCMHFIVSYLICLLFLIIFRIAV